MSRLGRLLKLRKTKEQSAVADVADKRSRMERAEARMQELLDARTAPVADARRLAAFQMTGAWTADQLEAAQRELTESASDLDDARAALKDARTERRVLQEHVDRARAGAAVIAARVAQSSADELALLQRMRAEREASEEPTDGEDA